MQHLLDIFEEAASDVREVLTLLARRLFDTGQAFTDSFPTQDETADAVAFWDASSANTKFHPLSMNLDAELDEMVPLVRKMHQKNAPDAIALLLTNEGLERRAHGFLDKQLVAYPDGPSAAKLDTLKLEQKVGALNKLWQAKYNPPPPTFTINVVHSVFSNGRVDSINTYYVETDTDWWRLQQILKAATESYQSWTEDGCPHSYTTEQGKWQYQKMVNARPDPEFQDLMDDADLAEMRRYLKSAGRNGGVLIWHERIRERSDTWRREHQQSLEITTPNPESLDENGKPFFDPEPTDWLDAYKWEFEDNGSTRIPKSTTQGDDLSHLLGHSDPSAGQKDLVPPHNEAPAAHGGLGTQAFDDLFPEVDVSTAGDIGTTSFHNSTTAAHFTTPARELLSPRHRQAKEHEGRLSPIAFSPTQITSASNTPITPHVTFSNNALGANTRLAPGAVPGSTITQALSEREMSREERSSERLRGQVPDVQPQASGTVQPARGRGRGRGGRGRERGRGSSV